MDLPHKLHAAQQHHRSGRFTEAEALYRQILDVNPEQADALHSLGLLAHQIGRNDRAIELIERAASLRPQIAEYLNSLGEAYRATGRLDHAIERYRRAIALSADYPAAHSNLGLALLELGRPDEAAKHLRRAVALDPDDAAARNNLGVALLRSGKLDSAINEFRQTIQLRPGYSDAHGNLATALLALRQFRPAVAQLRRQLSLRPGDQQVLSRLAQALVDGGKKAEGIQILLRALAEQSASPRLRQALAAVLHGTTLAAAGEIERSALLALCNDENFSAQRLAGAVIGLTVNASGFAVLREAAQWGSDPIAVARSAMMALMADPLLSTSLPRIAVVNADLERVLTNARRWALLRLVRGDAVADFRTNFLGALARQCFFSGYAFLVTDGERMRLKELRNDLEAILAQDVQDAARTETLEYSLLVFAAYDPLNSLAQSERLLDVPISDWSEAIRPVLVEQLANPQREQEIARRIPAATPIVDSASQIVRQHFEENPYPVWASADRPEPISVRAMFARLAPERLPLQFPLRTPVLIAGCGTGHHALMAARAYHDADVLAVDLSRRSLAYAARMAKHFAVENVTFQQADILELDSLGQRFFIIECVGVLQVLADPMQGWRVLAGLLESRGLMKIGLYSTSARSSVRAARRLAREKGFQRTPEGIRRFRRAILDLPPDDPAKGVMQFIDFFTLHGCSDLVFHWVERSYSVQEIAESLRQLGLRFRGFDCYSWTMDKFKAMHPAPDAHLDLTAWARFEEAYPDTFVEMYQFWCQKS